MQFCSLPPREAYGKRTLAKLHIDFFDDHNQNHSAVQTTYFSSETTMKSSETFVIICYAFICKAMLALGLNKTVDIEGVVDISVLSEVTNPKLLSKIGDKREYLNSIDLELTQVYPYKNESDSVDLSYYNSNTKLSNAKGKFQFDNVPLDLSNNMSYFAIKSSSKYFNFSPSRILVSINNSDSCDSKYQANYIGKDYFPTLDILYPETLPVMNNLTIKLVTEEPIRNYIVVRNDNILTSGFLGSIFESKWKSAALITVTFMMLFPYIIGYIDPEAAAEMKRRKRQAAKS